MGFLLTAMLFKLGIGMANALTNTSSSDDVHAHAGTTLLCFAALRQDLCCLLSEVRFNRYKPGFGNGSHAGSVYRLLR